MLLQHINNTDVAIEILRNYYAPDDGVYKLRVRWWNTGKCHAPYAMDITEDIVIKEQDINNWKPYKGEEK